jgi:hypothetical protein
MYNYFINERQTMEIIQFEEITFTEDDFWEEEVLSPEEQLESNKAQARLRHEEAIGEMYASQFAFD